LSLDDQLELGLVSMEDLEKNEGQVSLLGASEKTPEQHSQLSEAQGIDDSYGVQEPADQGLSSNKDAQEAPLCFNCGNITQRAGSCYVCTACGSTSGCS
ncbi:MAG: ribonucleoside-diphosphate reductase alpha chain, partial [Patescibacteria group bacterium]|nr:ribonucleoside-diphosphate reductase alpha chain [Patescibacteria group bacterium]